MAALAMVRSGKIELNSDIIPYMKPWNVPFKSGQRHRPIPLKSILNHSAGINIDGFPGYARGATVPNVDQVLAGTPPSNTPGIQVESQEGSVALSDLYLGRAGLRSRFLAFMQQVNRIDWRSSLTHPFWAF